MTLHLDNVTLTYPDGGRRLTALNRVNLTAEPGTLTAIVGPSGSGKSSLIAVAATLITPDSGRVELDGQDLARLNRKQTAAIRREKIGIVFQSSNLLASMTAIDQLLVIAHLAGKPIDSAHATAMELLDAVGLTDQANRRPHQLSGGQRQRVTIARGLMNNPSLLLVDEPTSALDTERGQAILTLLRQLTTERNLTTVMVTHNHDHLADADRVIEIIDGRTAQLARNGVRTSSISSGRSGPTGMGAELRSPTGGREIECRPLQQDDESPRSEFHGTWRS